MTPPSPTELRRVGRDITQLSSESLGCGQSASFYNYPDSWEKEQPTKQISCLGGVRHYPKKQNRILMDLERGRDKHISKNIRLLKYSISVKRSSSSRSLKQCCPQESIIYTQMTLPSRPERTPTLQTQYTELLNEYVPLDVHQAPQNIDIKPNLATPISLS